MNFAVVKIGGKQHLVSENSEIETNGLLGKTGDKVEIKEVLLQNLDGKISVGTPLVDGAVVATEIVNSGKGEKIRVAKFKSKVRYRKVMGFRPLITKLRVLSVVGSSQPQSASATVKKAKKQVKSS